MKSGLAPDEENKKKVGGEKERGRENLNFREENTNQHWLIGAAISTVCVVHHPILDGRQIDEELSINV